MTHDNFLVLNIINQIVISLLFSFSLFPRIIISYLVMCAPKLNYSTYISRYGLYRVTRKITIRYISNHIDKHNTFILCTTFMTKVRLQFYFCFLKTSLLQTVFDHPNHSRHLYIPRTKNSTSVIFCLLDVKNVLIVINLHL